MNRKRWALITVLLAVLVLVFSAAPVSAGHKANHGKGQGGGLTATLIVKANFVPDDHPHLHILVTHEDVGPVKAAKVVVTITRPDGSVGELRNKTDPKGVAHFERGNFPPPGEYIIHASAKKDEASGSCTGLRYLVASGNISVLDQGSC